MPAPPSRSQTDAKNSIGAKSASSGRAGGAAGAKSASGGTARATGGVASSKGPGASQAAAKANAQSRTAAAGQKQAPGAKSATAGRVPGSSAAAAKNTALGKAATATKQNAQNARPSGTSTQFGGRPITQRRDAQGPIPRNISKESYGWTSTGPSRLAAHQGYGIYGGKLALQGETPTQKQFDTMLRANTVTTPKMFNAVSNLSPFMRQNAAILTSAARLNNVPNAHALGMGAIESKFGTVKDRPGSQYQGLTQMGNWEFKNYSDATSKALGKTNPWASAQAGTAYMGDLANTYRNRIGAEPTTGDVYGMYNQGAGGYTSLRRNPDSFAKDVVGLERVRQNLPGHLRGGASTMPAAAFADTISSYPDKTFARLTRMPAPEAPVQVASAALGSIPRPQARPADLRPAIPRPQARPADLRDPRRMAAGTYTQSYDVAPPIPNMRPDSFPRGFGDVGIGRTVNSYTPPSFGDEGVGRTVNPYSPPVPIPTARPDSFPRGFGDEGVTRTVNPYNAPVSPFSDAGIRKPVTPFAGMPAASIVPPIPKARPPMQGPPKPMGGMSFTPGLPGQQKQYYDRVAQTPGPQQQYALPAYPGAQPAGTYTAPYDVAQAAPRPTYPAGTYTTPYDVAPRMSPFGNAGQEYHQHTAPPTPSQYRNEMPPAAPNMGTPGSQTAEAEPSFWQQGTDLFKKASTAVEPYVKQAQDGAEELKNAVEAYGEDAVLTYLQQQAGAVPQSLRDPGPGSKQYIFPPSMGGYRGGPSGNGAPAASQPQLSPTQMATLLQAMQAKGATPEEIAYVQSMMTTA